MSSFESTNGNVGSTSGTLPAEADIVIAGGGTAACVIAARLTEALPDLEIVMIEEGPETMGREDMQVPALSMGQVFQGTDTVRMYMTQPSNHVHGRSLPILAGRCVGGGTSVNYMLYNNPAASDFDDWKQPGWSFEELLPFLKKKEDFHSDDPAAVHGTDGPMYAGFGDYCAPVKNSFDKAVDSMGIPHKDDIFDYNTGHSYGNCVRWISPDGKRQEAAERYLTHRGHRKTGGKIQIFTGRTVSRVIIDNGIAKGLEVIDTGKSDDSPARILARKQVLLCAGTFGSPTILERSGVGDAKLLHSLGIEVIEDLPGVGREFEDHQAGFAGCLIPSDMETHDGIFNGDQPLIAEAMSTWKATGGGLLSSNMMDGVIRLRPTADEVEKMGPEYADRTPYGYMANGDRRRFKQHWDKVLRDKPDKPLAFMINSSVYMGPRDDIPKDSKTTGMAWMYMYPASRGSIHASSKDPRASVNLVGGMLSRPADLPAHMWAYKKSRSLLRRMDVFQGEIPSSNPVFATDSKARVISQPGPLSEEELDPVYSAEDDKALEEWLRSNLATCSHSMASCPMRPREDEGVVDSKLNVYGISNLKIADLSICPSNVGCNTASVALTIGEKAASILIQELQ